ncbi:MAG: ATP-binding cassette domain-containing protein [Burkholderiales bacterium]|nr:ATP-binding cassette domain-containing protein [Burkholderiales bacterium]
MLSVHDISKRLDGRQVLQPVTHRFLPGCTTAVVGPSGCGKTTLLRLLLGLLQPDTGAVLYDGVELTPGNAAQMRLRVGYVIQEGGLFPHLCARDNITLMADYLGHRRKDVASRVIELANLMHISPDMLARFPKALSGGQRQRIALMRSLMLDPPMLLMDEPLGALDPMIRFDLQNELKDIFARLNKTVVLVTHDMHEAAHFADQIVLMHEGNIVQTGSFDELLSAPRQPFVTEFIRAQRADARLTTS